MVHQNSVIRAIVPLVCVLSVIGAGIFSLVAEEKQNPTLLLFEQQQVRLDGVVVRDPDVRDSHVRLTVRPEIINGRVVGEPTRFVLVSIDRFTNVSYGDSIQVEGTLKKPEAFETDTGRYFNYPKFLFAHNITHSISFAEVSIQEKGEGNMIVASLLSIKHVLLRGIERALPEPQSALLAGLLLGEKQSLGDRLTNAFRKAGVVHIIVLSGYNVALVISSINFVALRILPRSIAFFIAALSVIGFAIMTGGSETTIRATIMALLMMLARAFHRPGAAFRGLMIAAAVMALWNPYIVLYDLSFQLSVLATLGLILFSDPIAQKLRFITEKAGFREIVSTTIATQVTVLPLLVFSIGAVSLVFLPANALVLPAVPLAMLFGFIASLVALVFPPLSLITAFPAHVLLSYIISLSEFFGERSFSSVTIPHEAMSLVLILLLVVYGASGLFFKRKTVLKLFRR